jgi:hypothetical protein
LTTKKIPFDLLMGYTLRLYVFTSQSHMPKATRCYNQLLIVCTTVLTAIKNTQQMLLKHILRKKGQCHFYPFTVGQKVWLEGTNLKMSYLTKKFAPRHYGPFPITDMISPIMYHLTLPPLWKIHNIFHMSLLTPYKEMEKHSTNFAKPPPDLIDKQEEYEVKQVLTSCYDSRDMHRSAQPPRMNSIDKDAGSGPYGHTTEAI